MSRTTARFTLSVLAGAGVFGGALALSPDAAATPLKTGGYACVQDSAGVVGAPAAADGPMACAGAPVADMAGVPLALPGPLPVGAGALAAPVPVVVPAVPAGVAPIPAVVPGVPAGVAPIPAVVPPVPAVIPPVIAAGAPIIGGVPAPVGVAAAGLPVPVAAPILDMGGVGGKGAPTGPAPAGEPSAGQPIIPGPPAAG